MNIPGLSLQHSNCTFHIEVKQKKSSLPILTFEGCLFFIWLSYLAMKAVKDRTIEYNVLFIISLLVKEKRQCESSQDEIIAWLQKLHNKKLMTKWLIVFGNVVCFNSSRELNLSLYCWNPFFFIIRTLEKELMKLHLYFYRLCFWELIFFYLCKNREFFSCFITWKGNIEEAFLLKRLITLV